MPIKNCGWVLFLNLNLRQCCLMPGIKILAIIIQQNRGSSVNTQESNFNQNTLKSELYNNNSFCLFQSSSNNPFVIEHFSSELFFSRWHNTIAQAGHLKLLSIVHVEDRETVKTFLDDLDLSSQPQNLIFKGSIDQEEAGQFVLSATKINLESGREVIQGCVLAIDVEGGKNRALSNLHDIGDKSNPKTILTSILHAISATIDPSAGFIGAYEKSENRINFLSWWSDNENFHMEGFAIDAESADQIFHQSTSLIIPDNAQNLYPQFSFLQDWKISGFAFQPLRSSKNEILGLIGILNHSPLVEVEDLTETMGCVCQTSCI